MYVTNKNEGVRPSPTPRTSSAASPRAEEERIRVARIVADHWRRAALEMDGDLRIIAHPMCMVLAALDGETDPEQLGVADGPDAEAIRANPAMMSRLDRLAAFDDEMRL